MHNEFLTPLRQGHDTSDESAHFAIGSVDFEYRPNKPIRCTHIPQHLSVSAVTTFFKGLMGKIVRIAEAPFQCTYNLVSQCPAVRQPGKKRKLPAKTDRFDPGTQ